MLLCWLHMTKFLQMECERLLITADKLLELLASLVWTPRTVID